MARQVNPGAFSNAFNAERDRGERNRLMDEQRQQQEFQNARVSEADAQNRTLFQQQQGDRESTMKRQSLSRVGAIAKQALSLQDPMQRKGFLQQAIPAYSDDFAAIGSDASKLDAMLALPDEQLLPMLTQVSQFAPGGEAYTLGKNEKRMVGDKVIASNMVAEHEGQEVEYRDAGDRLVPVYKQNGQPVPNLEPIAKGKLPGSGPDKMEIASKLRTEYNKQAEGFTGVADAYQRIKDSASNPSAAGDIALLFNYLKVLDPGSTVREGEFETVASSGGLPNKVQTLYNRMVNGLLPTDVRTDVVNRAGTLYKGQEDRFNSRVKSRYEGLAKRYGVDPAEVLSSPGAGAAQFATEEEAAAAGLQPGTKVIINGVSGTWQK